LHGIIKSNRFNSRYEVLQETDFEIRERERERATLRVKREKDTQEKRGEIATERERQ
jgi:hypothetical protein